MSEGYKKPLDLWNFSSIFNTKNYKCKNSNIFEKELLCLPNHKRVNYIYINKIVKYIEIFLNKK